MSRKTHLRDCDPSWNEVDGVRIAIRFFCPEADGGCQGYHRIPINYGGDQSPAGERARWGASGELPDVTIVPSVACHGGCRMHINITNGEITYGDDSASGPESSS
jgi:hypothetical protein